MKKILCYMILLVLPVTTFCQQTAQTVPVVKTDYLKKSKSLKTGAWIMVAGGAALIMTSAIIPKGEKTGFSLPSLDYTYENDGIKAALVITGYISTLGCIPLFYAASKNRKRAEGLSASFKMESLHEIPNGLFTGTSYPTLSIKINL